MPPVQLRVFQSGLRVLHTPKYGDVEFQLQLSHILSKDPKSTIEVAVAEGISVGLAEEMIASAENASAVARDEGGANGETRWYTNVLEHYVWDGELDEW